LVNNPIELEESSHKDGVKILTIHAAKGLESKTVILINNILEKQFSSKNHKIMQSMDDQLLIENQKESSRLLYVALTRTKEKLILINE
jgi:ATP-dependent exoDNAse (exonuclease V) beta subunit